MSPFSNQKRRRHIRYATQHDRLGDRFPRRPTSVCTRGQQTAYWQMPAVASLSPAFSFGFVKQPPRATTTSKSRESAKATRDRVVQRKSE
ncbi:NADH oxidase [Anopheles sinensis]|uniref:NADH oxidase n=1 Tax=Anopheles sinensis TaxID=74873 RepID=A0A084WPL3_ANOSI|nr:NADH oxidase [Anopheles sinensis]